MEHIAANAAHEQPIRTVVEDDLVHGRPDLLPHPTPEPVPVPSENLDQGPPPEDEQHDRAALLQRIEAASTRTLGQVATVYAVDGVFGLDAEAESEPDTYSWTDSARWYGGASPDDPALLETSEVPAAMLGELFARIPDEECGSTLRMGWCGLIRREDRPGGVILRQNEYGRQWAWATDSDDELTAKWQAARDEQAAYEQATNAASGAVPQIWVGSLADYNAGILHGTWLDAVLDPEELTRAVQFIVCNSHEPDAEEYAVFDYDGFGHDLTSQLGQWPDFATVSKIAQGIAEHGSAYGAWAAYVGLQQTDQLDRFEDHYLGEWDNVQAYAEDLLSESDAYRLVEQLPDWLQPYVHVDAEAYARDLEIELHVAEKPEGGVWIFDTAA